MIAERSNLEGDRMEVVYGYSINEPTTVEEIAAWSEAGQAFLSAWYASDVSDREAEKFIFTQIEQVFLRPKLPNSDNPNLWSPEQKDYLRIRHEMASILEEIWSRKHPRDEVAIDDQESFQPSLRVFEPF